MSRQEQFAVFRLDGQRIGVPVGEVERFVAAVDVTPLPGAPQIVVGMIDVAGTVAPVVSLRRRFGLADKPIAASDQFLLARTPSRLVALVVDEALGVVEVPAAAVAAASTIVPGLAYVDGVVILDDGLVLIHALDRCLSLSEEREVADALERSGAQRA